MNLDRSGVELEFEACLVAQPSLVVSCDPDEAMRIVVDNDNGEHYQGNRGEEDGYGALEEFDYQALQAGRG